MFVFNFKPIKKNKSVRSQGVKSHNTTMNTL